MREQWKTLEAHWEALALRERALLLTALIAAVVGVFDFAFLVPVDNETARLEIRLAELQDENLYLAERTRELATKLRDQGKPIEKQRARLVEQTERIDEQIEEHLDSMIPPGEVTKMLEALLARESGLQLQRIVSLVPRNAVGRSRIAERETAANPSIQGPEFYRHGFRIELEGNYLATLQYLEAIEDLSWDLSWDRMLYEVKEYPRAAITIELHTLSEEKGWIGV